MKKSASKDMKTEVGSLAQLMLPLAALVRGDLRELVTSLGLRAIAAMIEQERTVLCGPLYAHNSARAATRNGTVPGELTYGGRKVKVRRPRVVDRDGHDVPLGIWSELSCTDPLCDRALEQMTIGVATRKYARSLEPLPEEIASSATSKSAVSRRFVEATTGKLAEWMARPLGELDLAAIFIDGIHFGEHVVLAALGVDSKGTKHVLGVHEGATENGGACRALLADLVTRGVPTDRSMLFIIDGSGALRAALRDTFGKRAVVQRCQVHKMRNVESHLPESKRKPARAAMRQAYKSASVKTAKRQLENLARTLQATHPSAAASIREGLDETLTVLELGLSHTLTRSFSTTNPIENMNDRIRQIARRVKRWRGGEMILRWVGAGVWEAERGFRRLKGSAEMPKLIAALAARDKQRQSQTSVDVDQKAA
jgi:transposase-like protein